MGKRQARNVIGQSEDEAGGKLTGCSAQVKKLIRGNGGKTTHGQNENKD